MKKIINGPQNLVGEMCAGMVMAHPELDWVPECGMIKRQAWNKDKVILIGASGSGHEPANVGFVGRGMLDAAICGNVFQSPSYIQIYRALREVKSNKGILMILENREELLKNFHNAAFLAKEDGIDVEYIVVDEDMAADECVDGARRRGGAGLVLVHKIAGAAAEWGLELSEVKRLAQKTIDSMKTIGVAFSSCTTPVDGQPVLQISEEEMEYGVGISGEVGAQKEAAVNADVLGVRTVIAILNELKPRENAEFAVLINGFGGTPLHELYVLNQSVQKVLQLFPVKISRVLVGNYVTSIDMAGASVTILNMDDELKTLLSHPCDTPAITLNSWPEFPSMPAWKEQLQPVADNAVWPGIPVEAGIVDDEEITVENICYLVDKMSDCVIRNEVPFSQLDAISGDGDIGSNLAAGFRRWKEKQGSLQAHMGSIGEFLNASALILLENCQGTCAPLWGCAFRAAGKFAGTRQKLSFHEFAIMIQSVITGIQSAGKRFLGKSAVAGEKTLLDALIPYASTLYEGVMQSKSFAESFSEAALAAWRGAQSTEMMDGYRREGKEMENRGVGYPDAGAYVVAIICAELADSIQRKGTVKPEEIQQEQVEAEFKVEEVEENVPEENTEPLEVLTERESMEVEESVPEAAEEPKEVMVEVVEPMEAEMEESEAELKVEEVVESAPEEVAESLEALTEREPMEAEAEENEAELKEEVEESIPEAAEEPKEVMEEVVEPMEAEMEESEAELKVEEVVESALEESVEPLEVVTELEPTETEAEESEAELKEEVEESVPEAVEEPKEVMVEVEPSEAEVEESEVELKVEEVVENVSEESAEPLEVVTELEPTETEVEESEAEFKEEVEEREAEVEVEETVEGELEEELELDEEPEEEEIELEPEEEPEPEEVEEELEEEEAEEESEVKNKKSRSEGKSKKKKKMKRKKSRKNK